jgi:hypothetical protein
MPELAPELQHLVNAFDPWAHDRGEYYSLEWKARKGAESDEAFTPQEMIAELKELANGSLGFVNSVGCTFVVLG